MNVSLCMHIPRYLMKIISCFILKLNIVINISFIMGYNTLPMYGLSYNNGDIMYRNKFQFYLRYLFLFFVIWSENSTECFFSNFLGGFVCQSVHSSFCFSVIFEHQYQFKHRFIFFFSHECLDCSKNGNKEDRSIKKYSQDMKIYAS